METFSPTTTVLCKQTFSECRAFINLILALNTARGDIPRSRSTLFAMYDKTYNISKDE